MNKLKAALRRMFGRSAARPVHDESNPWAGLMSYSDPAAGSTLRFCGRDRETADLFYLVDNNFIVTMYGKSGIGKTSLLNAGLFPKLRAEGYHPVAIRLGMMDDGDLSKNIIALIDSEMKRQYSDDSVELRDIGGINADTPDSNLWRYFASHRFHDAGGNVIFPVVVFDQFEEVLRHNRDGALALLRELSFMADAGNAIADGYVAGKPYSYDFNFRFVLSIREDDLYRLEDIVDRNYISRIKDCRYRLQNLSDDGAARVIGDIGAPYIRPDDLAGVTKLITDASRNSEDGLVNTNVLSLLCARMYERYTDSKADAITTRMVESFISENPFEKYYEEAVKDLSEGEKRFIEDRLIDPDGRRNSISEKEFADNVRNSRRLFEGRNRIMQRVSASAGSKNTNVELLHDAMCPVILRNRTARLEQKNGIITGLCLTIIGGISYYCLETGLLDNIVYFFFACMNGNFTFDNVEAIASFIAIVMFPFMAGMVIYHSRMPWYLAALPFFITWIPFVLFGDSYFNVSFAIIVSISFLFLPLTVLDKENKQPLRKVLAKIWGLLSVKLFYLALACYLFVQSIFNTDSGFIINSTDSSWGIVVIPLLVLDISVALFKIPCKKWQVIAYICLLLMLCVGSFLLEFTSVTNICGIFLSLVLLWIMSRGIDLFGRIIFLLININALIAIFWFNLGYNPLHFQDNEVVRVFPWETVVVRQDGLYGTAAPKTGKMIVDAQFDSIKDMTLIRKLEKPYGDIIDRMMIFGAPWYLERRDSSWLLKSIYYNNWKQPKIKNPIADSIRAKAFEGYYRLKNATISYIINGNDSALNRLPYQLIPLSELLQRDLDAKLDTLSANAGSINEPMVCNVIEALSRRMYLNMMREALLKKNYTNVCDWYLSYYMSVLLTDEIPKGYNISFSANKEFNLNVNGEHFKEVPVNIAITVRQLAERNDAVAWYNMFYILFFAEYQNDMNGYLAAIQQNNNELENLKHQTSAHINGQAKYKKYLQGILSTVNAANAEQSQILEDLQGAALLPDSLKDEVIARSIKSLLEIVPAMNSIKSDLKASMVDYSNSNAEIDSMISAANGIALIKLDHDFESLIQSTYKRLLDIVEKDPNNIYNGLFITLCERLYTMGAIRLYDMSEQKKKMDYIVPLRVSGTYRLVVQVDSLRHKQNELINNVKGAYQKQNEDLQELIDQLNSMPK